MLGIFVKLFLFFFTLKKIKLSKEKQQFKPYQIFITVLIMIIATLNCLEFLLRGMAPIEMYRDNVFSGNDQAYFLYRDICLIIYTIVDCVTAFGILTLFYYVAKEENDKISKAKQAEGAALTEKRDDSVDARYLSRLLKQTIKLKGTNSKSISSKASIQTSIQ